MPNIKRIIRIFIVINVIMIILFTILIVNNHLNKIDIINSINLKKYLNIKDIIRPDIILKDSSITINLYEEYHEPGYQALDNIDGDITNQVKITSNLNNKQPGTYKITYSVTDSSGNKTSINREVKVIETIKEFSYTELPNDNEEIKELITNLNEYLRPYKVSVGYKNINTNFTYLYNAKQTYFGASLIKNLDAMYIYENHMSEPDILKNVKLAIIKSDNQAHKYLVEKIGFNNLKQYAKYLGAPLTKCNNLYFCDTTVKDQLIYLTNLYNLIKTLPNSQELSSYYLNNYGNYLNLSDTKFFHKYGQSDEYYHDIGISNTDNPYIIVILTSERLNKDIDYRKLINDISIQINNLNNKIPL